jgi:hypothetical protein
MLQSTKQKNEELNLLIETFRNLEWFYNGKATILDKGDVEKYKGEVYKEIMKIVKGE